VWNFIALPGLRSVQQQPREVHSRKIEDTDNEDKIVKAIGGEVICREVLYECVQKFSAQVEYQDYYIISVNKKHNEDKEENMNVKRTNAARCQLATQWLGVVTIKTRSC
jgi:hypothetical protein